MYYALHYSREEIFTLNNLPKENVVLRYATTYSWLIKRTKKMYQNVYNVFTNHMSGIYLNWYPIGWFREHVSRLSLLFVQVWALQMLVTRMILCKAVQIQPNKNSYTKTDTGLTKVFFKPIRIYKTFERVRILSHCTIDRQLSEDSKIKKW